METDGFISDTHFIKLGALYETTEKIIVQEILTNDRNDWMWIEGGEKILPYSSCLALAARSWSRAWEREELIKCIYATNSGEVKRISFVATKRELNEFLALIDTTQKRSCIK